GCQADRLRACAMKTNKLFGLITTALVSLSQPAWAGPHGGGGGHFGGFSGGASRAAPGFSGRGAYYTGRSIGAPRFYYGGARMSAVRPHGFSGSVTRSVLPYAGARTAITRQPSRVGSTAAPNRVSHPRMSRATNRGSFNTNRAFAHHDVNWHRDWDKRHAHFDHGHVFVFINGFWYGFYPWDYLPYYSSYP